MDPRDQIIKFIYSLGECPDEIARTLITLRDKRGAVDAVGSCPVQNALDHEFPNMKFTVGHRTLNYDVRRKGTAMMVLSADRVVELPNEVTDFINDYEEGVYATI
jgi:hypothetical protein